jgi:hypothetical protein
MRGHGNSVARSITRARIWRKILEFVRLSLPLLRVGREGFFDRDFWPDFRVLRIQRQPFLNPRVRVGLYCVHRTFRHANTAVDAFVRVDHQHVLPLVKAIHGTHLDAVHRFAANTALIDDVGQFRTPKNSLSTQPLGNRDVISIRKLDVGLGAMGDFGRAVPRAYNAVAGLSSIGPSSACSTHNSRCHCRQWAIRYSSRHTVLRNTDN